MGSRRACQARRLEKHAGADDWESSIFDRAPVSLNRKRERTNRPSPGEQPPAPDQSPFHTPQARSCAPLSPMPLRPTCLVRAGVRLSARLWARCDRAATARAGCALARSAPRAKGSTGAMSRGAATHGCPVTLVASGRSGAGWGWSQGLPFVRGGLGGALRRKRRRFSFRDFSAACPPWSASPRSSAWAEFCKISRKVSIRLRIFLRSFPFF